LEKVVDIVRVLTDALGIFKHGNDMCSENVIPNFSTESLESKKRRLEKLLHDSLKQNDESVRMSEPFETEERAQANCSANDMEQSNHLSSKVRTFTVVPAVHSKKLSQGSAGARISRTFRFLLGHSIWIFDV
jgi:hypothetical protein